MTTVFEASFSAANSVVVQSDGKIVVAGSAQVGFFNRDLALARYTSTGALDTTFGGTGKVTTDFGGDSDSAHGVVVQSDGKILAVGHSNTGTRAIVLVRYHPDGSLDTTFNGTGKVVTDLGGNNDHAYGVALQKDGEIVVAGYSYAPTGIINYDFALVRYTSTGALDTSFNGTGKVITDLGGYTDIAYSLALQDDGRIVVAGIYRSDASFTVPIREFAVVRYTGTGALDTSFNGTGKVTTNLGAGEWAYSVAVQSNGRIVVAGEANDDFALARAWRSDRRQNCGRKLFLNCG